MAHLLALPKKELRENAALFFAPAALLFALFLARDAQISGISGRYLELMAVALPVALAAAFGLQAFDAEENFQTRDFLLAKPLSPRQIVTAKYFTGLGVLLALSLAGEIALLPEAVRPPSFADYSTFWFYSYSFLVLVVHGACFATAARVKGPGKVLWGALFAALCAGWFFSGFFSLLASFYHLWGNPGGFLAWAAVFLALAVLSCLLSFLLASAEWALQGLPFGWIKKRLWRFSAGLLAIPLALSVFARASRPAIRPFSSLFATFLGGEEWFAAVSAVKQPEGDLYALADAHGRLATAKEGGRPRVVYPGKGGKEEKVLSSLAWSPDGRRIAFCEDGIIKVCEMPAGRVIPVLRGERVLWSTDPERMLVLKREGNGNNTFQIHLADFTKRTAAFLGAFDLAGLALGWDAQRGEFLVLGPDRLLVFDLGTKESRVIPLPASLFPEFNFLEGRILPPGRPDRPFRLVLFTAPRVGSNGMDVYSYDYHPARGEIEALPPLRGLVYEELVLAPGSKKVLGRLGLGVYRVVQAEEGGR